MLHKIYQMPTSNLTKCSVHKFEATGFVTHSHSTSRSRSVKTKEHVDLLGGVVKHRLHCSIRKLAFDLNISRFSVHTILKKDIS